MLIRIVRAKYAFLQRCFHNRYLIFNIQWEENALEIIRQITGMAGPLKYIYKYLEQNLEIR